MKIRFLSSLLILALLVVGCEDDNTPDIVINDNSTVNNNGGGNNGGNNNMEDLFGFISSDMTLDPNITYRLAAATFVDEGATLTIPAGTRIVAEPNGVQNYIAVLRGGDIIINGTANNPVVMTSGSSNPGPGDWGGLVILGEGTTNLFDPAGSVPDDLPTSEVGQLQYGGNDGATDSGSINYLRLEYVGGALNGTQELNGLSLYAVGSDTEINNVQVFQCSDDGIEFFGGDVDVTNLVITGSEDDSVDWTEGFTGSITNVYVQQTLDGDSGFEMDGFNTDFQNSDNFVSMPTITNVTVIGSGDNSRAFRLRAGTGGIFSNVVIQDFGRGVIVENDTPGFLTTDNIPLNLQFTDVLFGTGVTTQFSYGFDDEVFMMDPANPVPTQADVIGGDGANATGAGNGTALPTWAQGWTVN